MKTKAIKGLMLSASVLGTMVSVAPTAFADDSIDYTIRTQLETELKTYTDKTASLSTQLVMIPAKAKAQRFNVESQITGLQEKTKLTEKALDAENKRIQKLEHEKEQERQRIEREKEIARQKEEAKAKREQAIANGTPIAGHLDVQYTNQESNSYPWGQCTWGVRVLAGDWVGPFWGNGAQWDDSARAQGLRVGTTPVVGSVIVWDDGGYGHVAYVTDVREDGYIQVHEANYGGSAYAADPRGIGNYRGWFKPTGVSYIYPPEGR